MFSKNPNQLSPSPPLKRHKHKHETTKYLLDSFRQGDLLFGLNSHYRTELVTDLTKRGYKNVYANTLNNPVVGLVVNNSKDIKGLTSSQIRHYKFLSTLSDYLIRPNGKPVPAMKDNPIEGAAYRRACKSLIRYADKYERVHFELTDIDIKRVCKNQQGDLGVTNSELRAAYRQAKDFGENPYVLFYQGGKKCPPPWKQPQYQEYFKEYDQKRKMKK